MTATYLTIAAVPRPDPTSAVNLTITPEPWMRDGSCLETGGDEWFQEGKGYQDARKICYRCPVMEQCGAYAIRERINEGMFGGMTPVERAAQRRKSNPSRKPRRENYGPASAVKEA